MKFLPLLFIYVAIVLSMSSGLSIGDENRYIMYANNLTHGYYSPMDRVYLWNGPGYPLLLAPFILLKLPWITAKLLNPILLFLAVLYFDRTLRLYIKGERRILLISYVFGCYPLFFVYLRMLHTEILSVFLICGFMFHFCKIYNVSKNSNRHLFIASLYLAYLALTKIFFGYVILTGIILFFALYVMKRHDIMRKTLMVYLIGLIICSPYLLYTYSLTSKLFYWGDSGGLSLYWMSTPNLNEYGDWFDIDKIHNNENLTKHHVFFDNIESLSSVQRDDELKKEAINQILAHPAKYMKNISANIGRMLLNYPYSYTPQKMSTYFYMIPNMFIVVTSILCLYPYFARRKMIPGEIHVLMFFFLVSSAGSALVSAYPRQFMILVPVLLLWLFFVMTDVLRIELRN